MTQMNELGFYTLAGAPESPRELIDSRATGIEPGCPPRRADRLQGHRGHRDRAWMPTTPG
ncbi:MAG: hypothetical protein OXG30_02260 [bacterium]|nr:hypothetical protein [bacterium]